MKKRILALVLVLTCIIGTSAFASAGTIAFDITVASDGANTDPHSYKEAKDDNEQNYYVTCTHMSAKGKFTYRSCSADGSVIGNASSTTYEQLRSTNVVAYGKTAKPDRLYYLDGLHGYMEDATYISLNILGMYCP